MATDREKVFKELLKGPKTAAQLAQAIKLPPKRVRTVITNELNWRVLSKPYGDRQKIYSISPTAPPIRSTKANPKPLQLTTSPIPALVQEAAKAAQPAPDAAYFDPDIFHQFVATFSLFLMGRRTQAELLAKVKSLTDKHT